MDIRGLISLPGWLVWILCIAGLLYLYTFYKQNFFRKLGVSGPKPVPFLGVLPLLMKKGPFLMDIELVRKHGKCFGVYVGNSPSLMVSDPKMIREICIKEFSTFTNRSELIRPPDSWRDSLISATGDHWKFLRRVINPAFSKGKIKNMSPILETCLETFFECLDEQLKRTDTLDLQKMFTALSMDFICRAAFGIDVDAQRDPNDTFVKTAYKLLDIKMGANPLILLNFIFPEFKTIQGWIGVTFQNNEASDFLVTALEKAIADRRADENKHAYNDLLALMINTNRTAENKEDSCSELSTGSEKRPLTDGEILSNAAAFFLAGHDSTASLLTWIAYSLATNDHIQDKLIAEIDSELKGEKPTYDSVNQLEYLEMVVSETLRLYTANLRVIRDTDRDIEICGVKIPKGTDVTIPVHGLHRLDEFWPEPEKFDPERFSSANKSKIVPYSYMPFGIGPRNCVGMSLALAGAKITCVRVLQYARFSVSEKTEIPPTIATGIVIKPKNGMFLNVIKR